ncbi:MAG: ATP synthase F1 subunit epsilon [Planctomycetota bacterium]|jgi:F-type H+-transporting ATPase subunit epsilon
MSKSFTIDVVTPGAEALSFESTSMQVPSWEGYLGVMANHAPMLCVLKSGMVTIKAEGTESFFAVRGGFMEVGDNKVAILADDFEAATAIKRTDAQGDLEAANAPAEVSTSGSMSDRAAAREFQRIDSEQKRAWAEARLKALDHHEGHA